MTTKVRAWTALTMIALALSVLGVESAWAAEAKAGAETPRATLIGDQGLKVVGIGIGAGLVVMGGAAGISRIGGSAVESMARQPEVAGTINFAMLLTAAMIEGATLFAVVVCLLALFF